MSDFPCVKKTSVCSKKKKKVKQINDQTTEKQEKKIGTYLKMIKIFALTVKTMGTLAYIATENLNISCLSSLQIISLLFSWLWIY
jgi:hypothetical protein